jgi:uncharacterized protein (TIGR02266 family)
MVTDPSRFPGQTFGAVLSGAPPPRRVPVDAEVSFEAGGVLATGLVKNIGAGGLFLATAARDVRPVGERLRLSFALSSGGTRVEAEGEVRWVRESGGGSHGDPPGMGLRFITLSHDARDLIASLLRAGS